MAEPPEASAPSPHPRDPSPTRDALLRAGRALFARRGYDGASIRAITREAEANLGAVTYHFGSKLALYEAVLASVLAPLAGRVHALAREPLPPLDRASSVVEAFFDHLRDNPDMPQLMLQEIAAGKPPPPPVSEALTTVLTAFARIVGDGQACGEIRQGDPVLLGLSCIIQPIHLTLARGWLFHLRGLDVAAPADRQHVVDHAITFARAALVGREPSS